MKAIGVDLAILEKRQSGFCILNKKPLFKETYSDKDITEEINKTKPDIIAIDAPLTMPLIGKSRQAEHKLRKMKISVYPPLIKYFIPLTKRGIRLRKKLEKKYKVIEVYPFAAKKVLNLDKDKIFKKFKIKEKVNKHCIDALIAAYTGKLFKQGKTIAIGDKKEGQIIIPK